MGRVDGDRGQNREELGEEDFLQGGAIIVIHLFGLQHLDASGLQLPMQGAPAGLLGGHEVSSALGHLFHLISGAQPILARDTHALAHLPLQARHAHHVEFVEIVGADRDKAQPLQNRMSRVLRLLQDTLVEGKPRHLAVKEAVGRIQGVEIQRGGMGRQGRRLGDLRGVVFGRGRGILKRGIKLCHGPVFAAPLHGCKRQGVINRERAVLSRAHRPISGARDCA